MAKVLGCAIFGPEFQVALISADQKALTLLAEVVFAVTVRNRWQTFVHARDLRDRFGHEILVLSRLQGQIKAGQFANLTAPKAGRVHNPFGANIALWCAHNPRAVWLLLGACHGRKA